MYKFNMILAMVAITCSLAGCEYGEVESDFGIGVDNDGDEQIGSTLFQDAGGNVVSLELPRDDSDFASIFHGESQYCTNPDGCTYPESETEFNRYLADLFPEVNIIWGDLTLEDPDDNNSCVRRDPYTMARYNACSTASSDDDDAADDDDASSDDDDSDSDDDDSVDDSDDDGNPGPDGNNPDDGPGPGDDAPDNGEEMVEVCYDPDGGSNPLQDPLVDEIYIWNHPESSWFDSVEGGVPLTSRNGNRECFMVQCDREYKWNGEVNGSNVNTSWHQYIAHNVGTDEDPVGEMWGEIEANDSLIEDVDVWVELWWNGDVPGYDAYLEVTCD